ncbi:hypothetical protein TNCV_3312901 [Trichonephila clavipes]|nr:hypothetical protein TNCV_3312901 [Trichonephila clavipes]
MHNAVTISLRPDVHEGGTVHLEDDVTDDTTIYVLNEKLESIRTGDLFFSMAQLSVAINPEFSNSAWSWKVLGRLLLSARSSPECHKYDFYRSDLEI